MRERAAWVRTMPVLFVRFGGHAVPHSDPLRVATQGLHPADALDNVQQLTTCVGVPVITNTRLEPNNRGSRRKRRRRLEQRARVRLAGKVGRLQGLEVTQGLGSWGHVHAPTLRLGDTIEECPTR